MSIHFTEESFEIALIDLYKEIGYEYSYGPEIERDLHEPLLLSELQNTLCMINPGLPVSAIDEAI